mmetsp:Transcript_37764/g.121412  ORF Transcript_37764/g.121412 Transcript_37764/m.121412 type:complete len:272 (-) Transcript_37764:66-881(-)
MRSWPPSVRGTARACTMPPLRPARGWWLEDSSITTGWSRRLVTTGRPASLPQELRERAPPHRTHGAAGTTTIRLAQGSCQPFGSTRRQAPPSPRRQRPVCTWRGKTDAWCASWPRWMHSAFRSARPRRSSLEAWYTRLRTWCVATPPPAALRSSRVRRSPSSSNHIGMHPSLRRLALHMTPFSKGDQNPRSSRRCARDSALYLSLSATCFAPRAKCTTRTIIRSSWRLATTRGARSDDSYDRDACCSYTPLPSHTFRFSCAHQSCGHAVQH